MNKKLRRRLMRRNFFSLYTKDRKYLAFRTGEKKPVKIIEKAIGLGLVTFPEPINRDKGFKTFKKTTGDGFVVRILQNKQTGELTKAFFGTKTTVQSFS